jgi:NADPH:quinone reductase-like Zn-dependent oxidoreductase
VGPGVTDVAVGARVADLPQIGAQAQYVCRPANRLVPIPDGPDPSEAVCLVLSYMTAYQMLHRVAGVQRGQRVLVHGGSGAVGTAFLQLGRLLDLDIVTTASPQHHDRLRALGATPIDYRAPDYAEQLQAAARDGFDAAFDAVGPSSLRRSRRLLRPGGTLVAYGTTATAQTISRRTPLQFVRFGLTFGLMMAGLTLWNALPNGHTAAFYGITSMREAHPEWFRDDLDALFALLADGQLTPRVHVLPLSEARRAHILVDRGAADGQVVLLPQPLPV